MNFLVIVCIIISIGVYQSMFSLKALSITGSLFLRTCRQIVHKVLRQTLGAMTLGVIMVFGLSQVALSQVPSCTIRLYPSQIQTRLDTTFAMLIPHSPLVFDVTAENVNYFEATLIDRAVKLVRGNRNRTISIQRVNYDLEITPLGDTTSIVSSSSSGTIDNLQNDLRLFDVDLSSSASETVRFQGELSSSFLFSSAEDFWKYFNTNYYTEDGSGPRFRFRCCDSELSTTAC